MITQNGFVLCEVIGEYEDTEIINLAFSDNESELQALIAEYECQVRHSITHYESLCEDAKLLIELSNKKLEEAFIGLYDDLELEQKFPKPEKWPPVSKKEHAE